MGADHGVVGEGVGAREVGEEEASVDEVGGVGEGEEGDEHGEEAAAAAEETAEEELRCNLESVVGVENGG